jgi:hypothetical protein
MAMMNIASSDRNPSNWGGSWSTNTHAWHHDAANGEGIVLDRACTPPEDAENPDPENTVWACMFPLTNACGWTTVMHRAPTKYP